MTVYVTQQPAPNKHNWVPDLNPAAQYGPIAYIFPPGPVFMATAKSMLHAKNALKTFDPNSDFICWPSAGDPAALYIAVMALMSLGHKKVNYLYWSRNLSISGARVKSSGCYLPITVEI